LADLSRLVSHALRHEPWLYELELDEAGGVPVTLLVEALRREPGWSSLTVGEVEAMVVGAKKQRHEIRDGRIRALYGHSLPGGVERVSASPPDGLFHGTSPAAAEAIQVEGLRPMGRQFVHLSVDRATAEAVGARKAPEPVILAVAASEAAATGVVFYVGNEKVWLADSVPVRFIQVDR
jgi:putative RNA 2'-phosphotransferase